MSTGLQNDAMSLPAAHPLNTGLTKDSALVSQLRGSRESGPAVWFMRQAGRSLPEYRELRRTIGMIDSCLTPDVATEITLQPVRRHGVDAAVFFSDIVVPLKLAGVELDIVAGVGPVIGSPVCSDAAAAALGVLTLEALQPITDAMTQVVDALGETPVVAFGGAPFTLASYLIEGCPSKDLPRTRAMMAQSPALWARILEWCAEITALFIVTQVNAGASALQVFDSWAGKLSPEEYRKSAAPYTAMLFEKISDLVDSRGQPVPRIHFAVGSAPILSDMLATGATAIGVDTSLTLAHANNLLGGETPLQGNIAVGLLSGPWPDLERHVVEVLDSGRNAPGHVVNLSHGVPKDTDPGVLSAIVELVHAEG